MKQDYKAPQWLDEDFLLKVLRETSSNDIQIKEMSIDNATNKGDNFVSEMFRIIVKYSDGDQDHEKSLILKKSHTDAKVSELFEKAEMYRNEINCYRSYLPEFHKILKSVSEDVKLAPEAAYYDLENQVLVMEDMKVEGYRTAEKVTRFSMEVAKMTLKKLARYHAASVIYNEKVGGKLEEVKNLLFCSSDFNEMFESILNAATEEIMSWGADYEKYLPDLTFLKENFNPICDEALIPGKGMGVFAHGDMWMNNILVQHKDENTLKPPSEVLLVDFQLCGWASRAIDVIYFIFTSLNEKDYQENFEEVLRFYNDEFTTVLEKFNYKNIPSYSEFREEVQKKLSHAFFGGVFVKAVVYKENTANADLDFLLNNKDKIREENFGSKRFKDEIKYMLKFFDENNVWAQCRETVERRRRQAVAQEE